MSRRNFMILIRDDNHPSPETRHITVYAEDEDHARSMGDVAAESMLEDFHKGRTFYVEDVIPLE